MRRHVLAGLVAVLAAGVAHAEPMFAARTGLGCGACHVNRTGGGARNAYGAGYGARSLPWLKLDSSRVFDGAVHERVRLGFDGRGGYYGTFRDPGPYIGEIKLSEANVDLTVDVVKDRLAVYVDEHVAPGGATSREAFALFTLDRVGFYVKGGKFFLPFGLRFQDDEAATRRTTGFTFETSDIGAEVGVDSGTWSTSFSVSNGTSGAAETDNGKEYCWTGARVWSLGRIGLSASTNVLPKEAHRSLAGLYGTFKAGPVVILSEVDAIRDDDGVNPQTRGAAGHLEVDTLAHPGITVRAFAGAGDTDVDDGIRRNEQWGIGIDWTPIPSLQIRGLYRARSGPATVAGANDDQAFIEAHVYF